MRVEVSPDLCEAHGKCEAAAPEVFELGEDDLSHVRIDDVPADLKEKVDRAIRLCPRQAIRWIEEA
jgi:ferredoxin